MTFYEYPRPGLSIPTAVCRKIPNNGSAIPEDFVLMTVADVKKYYIECDIGRWDIVGLADGKYEGYGYHFVLD